MELFLKSLSKRNEQEVLDEISYDFSSGAADDSIPNYIHFNSCSGLYNLPDSQSPRDYH
ncbi:MAG: hypothetical protein ACETWK_10475 [Candidatus Aminicenantaceae bacterium]